MGVEVAARPFTTTGTNVGVAQVPDDRLTTLGELSKSAKIVPAGLNVTDIAGLVSGAADGEGLGNQFLAQIRESDAILFVLREFDDSGVVYATDPVDAASDLDVLETELCLTDLESLEKRLPKAKKGAQGDDVKKKLIASIDSAIDVLGNGTPLYRSDLKSDDLERLRDEFLLTNKPVLYVINIDESALGAELEVIDHFREEAGISSDATIAAMCVELEAEIAEVEDPDERQELIESFGIGEPALPRVAHAAYRALGKRTFLTTGEKESRAWTIPDGANAREAAGAIHSDLERGFIRAEVADYEAVVEAGGWDEARKAGVIRLEGKDYIVSDGDVIVIRFNI